MERTINIHSLVDVITNSSTEIFISIKKGGVKMAYELLNHILQIGGSTEKAEDLFDIEIVRDWDEVVEAYFTHLIEGWDVVDDEELEMVNSINAIKDRTNGKWREQNDLLNEYKRETIRPYVMAHKDDVANIVDNMDYFGAARETRLKITADEGDEKALNIFEEFMNLFEMEEMER